jgi:hypothetical protein
MSATCPACQDGNCERCGGVGIEPGTGDDVICECMVFAQELAADD